MSVCLAIDIGGTKIAAALIESNHLSQRTQVSTPSSQAPSAMSQTLDDLISPLIGQANYVAVASTGIINDGVLTALNPENLGGLNNYPLKTTLENITFLPCYVINDAQAACWIEYQQINSDITDMAFITVSTGVGAGLVLGGELLVGRRGIAGHAGHMQVAPDGPICGCGRVGCVEAIASGTAITKAGKKRWASVSTGKDIHDKWMSGSDNAKAIFEQSAHAVAQLISNLRITLDIDVVTLGGSVGLASGYLELVESELNTNPRVFRPELKLAQAGADAGLLGAAHWAHQYYKKNN
ncbi:N-acetylmannosamine kinase [Vibrio toranzoniae]|uniref:N-acetylmannosamine kinase n=1 Tax=Vibrio toranzoniae TaxID=1194427 RepID=UPI001377D910|nr:N-acetylmannosamine kinase [Vibrio toranzoniae]NAZ95282.1 ROK family protein [Vibrio toranzoniae]